MAAAGYFQRLEALFDEGVALPLHARGAWLDALGLEPGLRQELLAMLAADDADSGRGERLTRRFGAAVAAATEGPLAGQQLGPYRLLAELGSGGAGVVFLGERADAQFRQQVAIKVIRGIATPEATRQLRHERQLLAEFDHPGIARLFDGGETAQGQPWLVMEYVRGAPITDACRERALPLRQRVALLADVAHAVHYAHQRLVIHRDIKPGNVLLREDGRPVLLDFGIAKLLQPGEGQSGQTQPWFTPAYASPEQRRGAPVSTATDVYALGLLLYELLTDSAPVVDSDDRLPAPSRALTGRRATRLRGDLDRIVLRATAPEPARRYPSAEALAEDLARHLSGRPVLAVPDSWRYRLGKFLQRHPWSVSAVAVLLAVLTVLAWRVADERDRALQAEAQALRESQAAEATTDFLLELFQEADPSSARGARMTPLQLVDRGRARLESRAELPPRERARLLGALGQLYLNLGQPVQATATLEAAAAAAERSRLPGAERAAYLGQLASALDHRADYGAAERAYRQGLALARAAGDPAQVADMQAGLGLMVSRQGRVAEAEPLLREALAALVQVHGHDSVEVAHVEVNLAELLRMAGRHDAARPLMDEAIAHLRGELEDDDAELMSALSQQAELLREMGENGEAERVLLEILSHRQAVQERDSELLALVHSALGSVYYEQGRTREATEQFSQTLAISQRTFAADDPSLAIDYNNLASLYEEMGHYDAAEPLFRQALAIMEQHADDHLPRLVQFRQNLGRLLMLAGKGDEARDLLEIAVPEGDAAEFAVQRGRQRLHLAEWHRRHGNPVDAEQWLAQLEANVDDIGGREAPRYAQALRTQALLLLGRGPEPSLATSPTASGSRAAQVGGSARRRAVAREALERAHALLVATRGERYVGVGELALDLAHLAHEDGRAADARRLLQEARSILEPVVVRHAPQARALAELAERIDAS